MNKAVLERVLRRLLQESMGPDTTVLAAFVTEIGGHRWAVAYGAAAVDDIMKSLEGARPEFRVIGDALTTAVRAVAVVKDPPKYHGPLRGAKEISQVAGPGKLTYGMAYALAGSAGIVPDRETVSSAARAAWKRAAPGRKRLPIDDMTVHNDEDPQSYERRVYGGAGHPHHTEEDPSDDGRTWGPRLDGDVLD